LPRPLVQRPQADRRPEIFRRQARHFEELGSPLYARLAERCIDEPFLEELVSRWKWHTPLQLFGGIHYLVLAGEAPDALSGDWADFRLALEEHADFLARFVAEQDVQTNEVQRSFALLPAFLTIAREARASTLDLLELGPAAGLNLLWDRYAYEYECGRWGGASALTLRGEERRPVPSELLRTNVTVRRRRGIDLNPVDVTTEHGARLLRAFVWPGREERIVRLNRAIQILRRHPPELIQGDYLELLPGLLSQRDEDALTVVFQTASTGYLRTAERRRLRARIDEAGAAGPLAWISTRAHDERDEPRDDSYELEVAVWPGGERRLLLRTDFHANWIEWHG
jgi:hypothetical protein